MNLYDLRTKQDLDDWAQECLVVWDNISPSPTTGYDRAVALLQFSAQFNFQQILIYVGVYELFNDGTPIISKSLAPYEEIIIANNSQEVDIETMIVTPKEEQDPNKTYMGEYDAYVYLTKNNPVMIWSLFETAITNSSKFK